MLAALLVLGLYGAGPGLHVATTGNDENPGTSAAAFATLTRARDAIRAMKEEDGSKEPFGVGKVSCHIVKFYLILNSMCQH